MLHTILGLALAAAASAGTERDIDATDCTRYLVITHWERVRYLELLSRPRALSAAAHELRLEDVLGALLSDGRVWVKRREADDKEHSRAASPMTFRVRKADEHGPDVCSVHWAPAGEITRPIRIILSDATLGPLELTVIKTEQNYEARLGPNTYPLFHTGTVEPHLSGGPREAVSLVFDLGGELREVRLHKIKPSPEGTVEHNTDLVVVKHE